MSTHRDAVDALVKEHDANSPLKAAFTEGYNAYARQFTAKYDVEIAWNTSVTRRISIAGQQTT